jgi:hypothetical protein
LSQSARVVATRTRGRRITISQFKTRGGILVADVLEAIARQLVTIPRRSLVLMHAMGEIKIEVWDATGNKRQLVEVPPDAEVNRLIAVLIDRMSLPRNSPDGQLMSYKFHHKASGRQLLDTETLTSANVQDGDILRLQPEITAGRN